MSEIEGAESPVEKRITQALIDNAFSCLDGHGRLTYARDECCTIQQVLREAHGVHLSLNECRRFWEWRSGLWDASFLTLGGADDPGTRKEILEFFTEWLDELDIWEWNTTEGGD